MKNPNIARALRYYRKLNNLSVDEVSDYLNAQNIPAKSKTIYGWENGNSQPNADTLMTLCGYYHIENILETFGYCPAPSKDPDAASILTKEERMLLDAYQLFCYFQGNLHGHFLGILFRHIRLVPAYNLVGYMDPRHLIFHKHRIAVAYKWHDSTKDSCSCHFF